MRLTEDGMCLRRLLQDKGEALRHYLIAPLGILLSLLYAHASEGADWKYFGSNDVHDFYYDKKSIVRISDNNREVWTRVVFTDKNEIRRYVEERRADGIAIKDYDRLVEFLDLIGLDCSKKKTRLIATAEYDDKGNCLFSNSEINDAGEPVMPGSIIEVMYKGICEK